MRTLKMRSAMARHWKLTTTNYSNHQRWSSYNYMRSCLRNECWPFYSRLAFEANAERWKNLISGCLMSWPQIKKLVILKHHILLFYTTTMNHFSIELWPVMKSGFYMTTGDDQLSGGTEKKLQSTSQSQTCCQSDPLQFSESQQNHYIWEVCSANHWDALKTATRAVGIGQQKGANSSPWQCLATHHTTKASEV